jgi:hypothetical protein
VDAAVLWGWVGTHDLDSEAITRESQWAATFILRCLQKYPCQDHHPHLVREYYPIVLSGLQRRCCMEGELLEASESTSDNTCGAQPHQY